IFHIPNLNFAKFGKLQVVICFPALYYKRSLNQTKHTYAVDQATHKLFVDSVLIPALNNLSDSEVLSVPLSYDSTQVNTSVSLYSDTVDELLTQMRRIILNNPDTKDFDSFFFIVWGLGFKKRYPDEGIISLHSPRKILETFNLNWDIIPLDKTYIDVGFSILPIECNYPLTGFVKDHDDIAFHFFSDDPIRLASATRRYDSFCNFENFGGFKHTNTVRSRLINMQVYSLSKHAFYTRASGNSDRHGRDFSPNEVLEKGRGAIKFIKLIEKNIELMKKKNYGVRFEFRLIMTEFNTDIQNIEDKFGVEVYEKVVWNYSDQLWSYAGNRINALWYLVETNYLSVSNRYSDQHLSFIAQLSYMLSAVFHRPMDRSQWRDTVGQTLKNHRRLDSSACFLPNLIESNSDDNRWSTSDIYTVDKLKAIFEFSQFETDRITVTLTNTSDTDTFTDVAESLPIINSLPSGPVYKFNLEVDDCQYHKHIKTEHYHFDKACQYFCTHRLGPGNVAPFVDLYMDEVFTMYKWDEFVKEEHKEGFNRFGRRIFSNEADFHLKLIVNI
ncbi:hypothetical protein BDF19DRAFT_475708, partial [Syncephalis fuscata]